MLELPTNIKEMHFLVVDDYESIRLMMTESLKGLGVSKITLSKSGNEAFEIIKKQKAAGSAVDFVVSDLMMEDGDGITLAKSIRGSAEFKDLPILMVTSKAEMNYVLETVKAGVSHYIIKPWVVDDLHKKIMEVVAKFAKK